MNSYRSTFQNNMQAADYHFVVRVAYFLDSVFQDSINDLENNHLPGSIPGTTAAAKGELEREQINNLIHSILGKIKVGVPPPIQLPASLLADSTRVEIDIALSSRTPATAQTKMKTPEKAAKADKEKVRERMEKPHNLLVVIKDEWILPNETSYGTGTGCS